MIKCFEQKARVSGIGKAADDKYGNSLTSSAFTFKLPAWKQDTKYQFHNLLNNVWIVCCTKQMESQKIKSY